MTSKEAIKHLEEIKDKLIPTLSRMYGSGFSSVFTCEKVEEKINNVIELLKEQQAEINFLKAMQLKTVHNMSEQELGEIVKDVLGK